MNDEILWGQIPKTGNLRTPITILREQAGLLGEATNNILQGDVSVSRAGEDFLLTLVIIAPSLDNYRYAILTVHHKMTLYPLLVERLITGGSVQCNNEDSFKTTLKDILSSPRVHLVIDSLLSQSQAA